VNPGVYAWDWIAPFVDQRVRHVPGAHGSTHRSVKELSAAPQGPRERMGARSRL